MPIPLPNMKGATLKTVVEWLEHHKADPVKEGEDDDINTEVVVPDWDKSILEPINKTSVLLELTVAANYLDIKALLNYTCKTIANSFKGKTGEQIREEWGVPNEFTPEEEAAIKKENEWVMWFTTGSLGVRVALAIASIVLNGRILVLVERCRRKNDGNVHKLFCLLYSTIPFFFILFSVLELITMNVHVTGTNNFNLVGICNGIDVRECAIWHGFQIACFIHNLLIIPIFLPFATLLCGGIFFGAYFGSAQLTLTKVQYTNPELLNSHMGFMMYYRNTPFDLEFVPESYAYGIYAVLGVVWAPAYLLSWVIYKMIPFKPRRVAPGINLETEHRLIRALLLCLASTSVWPITYLFYNVPLIFLHFPGVPLDLVMVSFNIVPVAFPLLQQYYMFRHSRGEPTLVAPKRTPAVVPYLASEDIGTFRGCSNMPLYTVEGSRAVVERAMRGANA
ncbi:hypothetical protein PRIPAC_72596 [Pristionchus pacificus]|uniref:Skp1 domain-containing protein n=1 Tax=Pristionchus pacificus TaxID=54126 RepID=A0A2A6C835_PRIPA|nr:hypothetical protein PRIPAC_72596 [Pristionchus pacificus]|eukprot:PDM74266.1 hypothetical protein PRIPAC_41622 [Pristionchus pacificus]